MDALKNLDPDLKPIYREHFSTIRTRIVRGRIRTMYYFMVTDSYDIAEYVNRVMSDHGSQSKKVNVAFGYILQKRFSDEKRFYHPSQNLTIYDLPIKVTVKDDYKKLIDDLKRQDLIEYAYTKRPSTEWRVIKLVCLRFDVFKL